ncbi:MAG: outer membrane beta-barrel protein [Pseudomonadota bacterium]
MSFHSSIARCAHSIVIAGTLAAAAGAISAASAAESVQASGLMPLDLQATSLASTTPSYLGFGRTDPVSSLGSLKDGPVMPSLHWNGCYVGLHAGGLFDDSAVRTRFTDVVVSDAGGEGFLGGGQIGCNAQYESGWVVGVEIDASFAEDIDALGSARLRIGYGPGTTLVYGTVGIALGETEFTIQAPGFLDEVSDTRSGVVAGGGVEFKLSDNLSFGVEGLYYGFSSAKVFDPAIGNVDVDEDVGAVRARLSLHFGDRGGFARSVSDF